jgi:hypothetical protein
MPISIFDTDYVAAQFLLNTTGDGLRDQIAEAIAAERERCAKIAEAIDSGRGNEKEIAKAIRDPSRKSE